MSKAIRYKNLSPITPTTPHGNDVRPGAPQSPSPNTTTPSAAPRRRRRHQPRHAPRRAGAVVGRQPHHARARHRSTARRRSGATAAPSPSRPARSSRTGPSTPPGTSWPSAAPPRSARKSSTGDATPAVDLAATRAGTGYWILTTAGGVWAFGSASWLRLGRPQQPRRRRAADARHAVGQGLLDPGHRRRHVRLRRRHLVRLGGQVGRHRRRRLLAHAERARATGS